MAQKIFTVLVGGKAGEGIKKAAQVIAHLAIIHNNHVFQTDDYQSLIKGGHNFSVVSMSPSRVYNTYKQANLVISFDSRSVGEHKGDLHEGGLHFCDEADVRDDTMIPLPLAKLVKTHYPEAGNMSLASIAIFCVVMGISEEFLKDTIAREFKRNQAENTSFALAVYQLVNQLDLHKVYELKQEQSVASKFYTGNQLLALGAWAAGLDCYFSYPMTPASSILHYLALKRDQLGIKTVHAESELAAANMALGACFAGKRAAVGSSGGGFALMQEAFSMAGMVEAPLLCFLSSRPGPATGVSTYTAQEDLFFALNQGHGEFPRIVASPDSFERAFTLAIELMNLAWESQSPAILLTEKHLSESATNLRLDISKVDEYQVVQPDSINYQRYQFTQSGISPLKFPGSDSATDDDVIKWNTNEHLESGVRTDKAANIKLMKEKRQRKSATIDSLSRKYRRVEVYGKGSTKVFAYGSTALELREAQKYIDFELVVPVYLEPFPHDELAAYRGKEVIVVEHSLNPNFARFLKEKLEIKVKANILRYDGRHFDAGELVNAIREAIDA